jgi:hypothetical protein
MAEPKTHGTKRAPAARWRGRKQIAGDRNQRFFAQAMRAHEGIICADALGAKALLRAFAGGWRISGRLGVGSDAVVAWILLQAEW